MQCNHAVKDCDVIVCGAPQHFSLMVEGRERQWRIGGDGRMHSRPFIPPSGHGPFDPAPGPPEYYFSFK